MPTDPALRAGLEALLVKVEKMLEHQKTACFGVDVREKYQTESPVIESVVKTSDAMHDLLFIRLDVKTLLRAVPPAQEPPAAPDEDISDSEIRRRLDAARHARQAEAAARPSRREPSDLVSQIRALPRYDWYEVAVHRKVWVRWADLVALLPPVENQP